jgi:hypothetical protein
MWSRLRALWDRLGGWFFSNEESAVITRQALRVLLRTGGHVLLGFAQAQALRLEETSNLSGPKKAEKLRNELAGQAIALGLQLSASAINQILETAVASLRVEDATP